MLRYTRPMLKRTSTAVWRGTGPKGTGAISTLSGALKDQPYSAQTRFAAEDGRAGWQVAQAKFFVPVGPGQTLRFALQTTPRGARSVKPIRFFTPSPACIGR